MTDAWVDARITRIEKQTPRITSFFFDVAPPFRAGQHVDVRLTAEDGYRAERSYSIASAPGTPVELAIDRLPDGEVSGFFHEIAAVGDLITLSPPRGGHFVWSPTEDDAGPLLLVAGGSGVVPFVSMLRHRSAVHAATRIAVIVAARTPADVPFQTELAASGARFLYSRADAPEHVARAAVDEVLASIGPPARVYVCGSNGFVNAATDAVLATGVRPEIVRTERYG